MKLLSHHLVVVGGGAYVGTIMYTPRVTMFMFEHVVCMLEHATCIFEYVLRMFEQVVRIFEHVVRTGAICARHADLADMRTYS